MNLIPTNPKIIYISNLILFKISLRIVNDNLIFGFYVAYFNINLTHKRKSRKFENVVLSVTVAQ